MALLPVCTPDSTTQNSGRSRGLGGSAHGGALEGCPFLCGNTHSELETDHSEMNLGCSLFRVLGQSAVKPQNFLESLAECFPRTKLL